MLFIKNFSSSIADKEILHGLTLRIKAGEIHAIMGPNGAGKSTLAMSLVGHPGYNIDNKKEDVEYTINGESMIGILPEERAKKGLFVSFQNPIEISGVSLLAFLRTATKALRPDEKIPLAEFKKKVVDALQAVNLNESFMQRSLNEGFSGGEKKRAEIAQMLILQPKFAILDEIDSGLDIDSLKTIADAIKKEVNKQKIGILIITHYQRILHVLQPDHVHILKQGRIVKSGDMKLVDLIEQEGYAKI